MNLKASRHPAESYTGRFSLLNRHKVLSLLLVIAGVLCLINQPYYPAISHDEGIFLHAPKSLVLYGQYATLSSEGLKPFDEQLSGIGPVVVWPIAGVFSVWGIGLIQARAVIGLYTLLAVSGLYLLGLELGSRRVAVLAVLLLLSGFVRDMLWLSRAVMGEVPALAFIAVGLWAWLRASRSAGGRAKLWLITCGLLLGAAITAKPQSILVLPAFALLWMLDRVYYRALSHRHFLIPMLASALLPALWYMYQALTLMHSDSASTVSRVDHLSTWLLPSTNALRLTANLMMLAQQHYLAVWGPALVYVLLMAADRSRNGLRLLLVPFCIGIWIAWWAFGSTGWQRYTFIPLALAVLPTAMLADKALGALSLNRKTLRGLRPADAYPIFMGLVLLSLLGFGLVTQVRTLRLEATTEQQDFAALVERIVPETAIIESWEWELDFLTQRTFHHPPLSVDATAVLRGKLGLDSGYDYDWRAFEPAYLIVGPHTRLFGLYEEDIKAGCCELVTSLDGYELYRVSH